jgi:hypothetical protein
MFVMGGIAESGGPELGLAVAGIAFVGVSVVLAAWSGFRELDRPPPTSV